MENKNKKIGIIFSSVLKICIISIAIFIFLIYILLIFIIARCSFEGNDFTIDENGIIKGESSPFRKVIMSEFEPHWDSYDILIKNDYEPLNTMDLNNIDDKYYIVYKRVSHKDSVILNSDFHLKPNQRYSITNTSVLYGHSPVTYTFTTDSLCRIDSIFHNTILIYPKRE